MDILAEICKAAKEAGAGALIVSEAGGTITDMEGNELTFTGASSVMAASAGVSGEDYMPQV